MPTAKTTLATSLLVLGLAVAGCSDASPTDASEKEFCAQHDSLLVDLADMSGTTQEEALDVIRKWGRDFEEVGTPEDMPEDAREAFDLMIREVAELKDGSTAEDFDRIDQDMTPGEEKARASFEEYVLDTCGAPEVPTGTPTPTS
ncbi:hypothetical protein [Nocardioides currus]|uniref:Lipoprotein n=1 Tax=Nocardioides currus TaxID=2133958 RepID=A0A2R7Z2W7_9ACTN|nr:hypothetical protein [Nocardioides currus]PUA82985.1 hypothetical protein C7S10_04700 [Nocardioides currus]